MGQEFTEPTRVWLGSEGEWELVTGISRVAFEEQHDPVDWPWTTDTSMTVTHHFALPCDSGRHGYHPSVTCEEHEALQKAFEDFRERLFKVAFEEAQRAATRLEHATQLLRKSLSEDDYLDRLFRGDGTGEMRGIASWLAEPTQQTPIERALQILAPHLARVPLYQPKER